MYFPPNEIQSIQEQAFSGQRQFLFRRACVACRVLIYTE